MWFPCLKTEEEAASETPYFIKKSDDGKSPKGGFVSDYFCLSPVNHLQVMANTRRYRMAFEVFALTTLCCCNFFLISQNAANCPATFSSNVGGEW